MTNVNTIGNFESAGNAPGVVPLGAIIAMTSGLTGAMAIPASGIVSNGYMRADGTAIPANNAVSGTPPDLTGSVFLRGAATYGGTGGGSATLVAGNIPQVSTSYTPAGSVDISHSHTSSTVSGTVGGSDGTHTHSHNYGANNNANTTNMSVNVENLGTRSDVLSGGGHGHGFSLSAAGQTLGATSKSLTGTLATITVGNASPTSFSVVPNYINVVYLIRVN
jgi:hypothetical protein